MIYLALLRGINVGGKSMVSMTTLKTCFEALGFEDVQTVLNSGNVLFRTDRVGQGAITKTIEAGLLAEFDLPVKALLKTHDQLKDITAAIPKAWVNNIHTKCDVMFLWPEADNPAVLAQLPTNPAIEEVQYVPGAVLWRVSRANQDKSRMTRIVSTPLYQHMTIRNPNTVRKLLALAETL